MPDEQIRPPDQVAAVGTPPAPDQAGVLDALRSRGPMPQQGFAGGPLQNIMQPPQQANLGTAFGSGVLNPQGPNPYLQGLQQQNKDQFYQQLNMQRQKDQQADRELRRQQADTTMLEGLLDKLPEDSQMRGPLAKQLAGIYTKAIPGVPAGPLAADLAQGKVPKEKAAQVLDMLDAGVPPEMISQSLGVSPPNVQRMAGIANSESARKALGFSTKAEQKTKLAEEQKKSLDFAKEKWGLSAKDPRTPFAMKYAIDTYGKSFSKLSDAEQKETVEKSQVLAQKAPAATTRIKNALAEFNPNGDIGNPKDVQIAMNQLRVKEQFNAFQKGVQLGQVGLYGKAYLGELNRFNQGIDRIGQLDILISDMDRLVAEGRGLHLTDNPQSINAIQQEITHLAGRPGSKGAEWYRAWDTTTARFATVAQAVEQITGNRLAVSAQTRALGFHPKQSDPYTVQERMIKELRDASMKQRELLSANVARTQQQYEGTAGLHGVPLMSGGEVESVEEEK